jgi:hypothetical protein
MNIPKITHILLRLGLLAGLGLAIAACRDTTVEETPTRPGTTPAVAGTAAAPTDSGYPSPFDQPTRAAGYPSATEPLEGVLPEPPDPPRDLPAASADAGVVGGVLIREITDEGFLPLTPKALFLAEIVLNDAGEAAFLRHNESSPTAELFPTGIFVFNNVPPGEYGLVIDVGFSQFPITGEDGSEILVTVEAGEAIDLGQLIVNLPQ